MTLVCEASFRVSAGEKLSEQLGATDVVAVPEFSFLFLRVTARGCKRGRHLAPLFFFFFLFSCMRTHGVTLASFEQMNCPRFVINPPTKTLMRLMQMNEGFLIAAVKFEI